jgi:hypothetical protein
MAPALRMTHRNKESLRVFFASLLYFGGIWSIARMQMAGYGEVGARGAGDGLGKQGYTQADRGASGLHRGPQVRKRHKFF